MITNKIYRNKKNKKLYLILETAIDASNSKNEKDKEMIIYISLNGQIKDKIFVREEKEFFEKFEETKIQECKCKDKK